jgi:hypothetical protein
MRNKRYNVRTVHTFLNPEMLQKRQQHQICLMIQLFVRRISELVLTK